MEQLIARAEAIGLRVKWTSMGRRNGELHSSGLIYLNPRKSYAIQRCTLAHEIGHAYHGHDWTRTHDVARDERQADTYAARLLVSPAEYALAERIAGHRIGAIARELNVSIRLIELWRESWQQEIASRTHLRLA